ncbi:MAG: diguanylate cyclase [Myxococcota bacterium]
MVQRANATARILVVDDSRLMRELASDALAPLAQVECAESGEEALERLDAEPFDLVVTDLEMKGMTGIELLERSRTHHPETAFIVVTAHASVESAIRALRMGASDYLRKPVQPEELSLTVERVLAHGNLLRDNERLRDALQTVDACRTLLHCTDPGEVYASSLDLLLHGMQRRRGVALFRRSTPSGSHGIVLRGFGEGEGEVLRRRLLEKAPELGFEGVEEVEVLPAAPFADVLDEVGCAGGGVAVVPMRGEDREGGIAYVFDDGTPFDETRLGRATLVSRHSALALINAERYHRAKERAFIDDVTEVYNARYLLQATQNEIQRAERYGKQLSVLFLDLDRFKLVNDRHGHLVGSRVLRRLSEVLTDCVRQVDTLARYGGDEFTILLVDTDLPTGVQVAERIRRTVADTIFEGEGGEPIRLTISVGVAAYPQHSEDRDGLLDLADKAMYRAKSRGRDCVCSASDLS